jgi:hypothetical protein
LFSLVSCLTAGDMVAKYLATKLMTSLKHENYKLS